MIKSQDYLNSKTLAIYTATRIEKISGNYKLCNQIIKHPLRPLKQIRLLQLSKKRQAIDDRIKRVTFGKFLHAIATNAYQFMLLKCLNCEPNKLLTAFNISPGRDTMDWNIILPNITDLRHQYKPSHNHHKNMDVRFDEPKGLDQKSQRIKDLIKFIMIEQDHSQLPSNKRKQLELLEKNSISMICSACGVFGWCFCYYG